MRIHFRRVKDVSIVPLHAFLRLSLHLPAWVLHAFAGGLGLMGRAYCLVPANHICRTVDDLCRVIGRSDGRAVRRQFMDNVVDAIQAYGRFVRSGPDALAEATFFDEPSLKRCRRAWERCGGAICVVPHCVGSVLSAVRFGREFPSLLLVRESRSERRSRIMQWYFERLGPEMLYVRRASPTAVTRSILKAFREGKFIVGTTDLARRRPDTIEVEMFGQRVSLPDWPARFAARRKVPIVPGYTRMVDGRIMMILGEPYRAKDPIIATQRWASFFEAQIRKSPADWLFMLEKRWSRLLAAAAAEKR